MPSQKNKTLCITETAWLLQQHWVFLVSMCLCANWPLCSCSSTVESDLLKYILLFLCSEAHASALESSLRNLGVEKLSKDEVQKMPWEILESKIGNWIHFMRIAVRIFVGLTKWHYNIHLVTHSAWNRWNFFLQGSASSVTKFLNAAILWGINVFPR